MTLIIYCKIKFITREWFGKSSRKCYVVHQPVGHSSFLQSNNSPLESHLILLGINIQSIITQFFCHACVCVMASDTRIPVVLFSNDTATNKSRVAENWLLLGPSVSVFFLFPLRPREIWLDRISRKLIFLDPMLQLAISPGGCGLYRRLPPPTKIKWNLYI